MMFKKTPALFAIWILLVATFGPIGLVSADEEQPVVSGKSICFQPGVGVVAVADKTDNSICVACSDDSGKVECLVENFNLPQDPQTDWDDPKDWFKGFGDPSYLVYYEAFPEGEEVAWQIPGNEMLVAGLVIEGVFMLIPVVGKPAAESAKAFVKTIAKKAATKASEKKLVAWAISGTAKSKVALQRLASFVSHTHSGDEVLDGMGDVIESTVNSYNPTSSTSPYTEGFMSKTDDVIDAMSSEDFVANFGTTNTKEIAKDDVRNALKINFKGVVVGAFSRVAKIPKNVHTKLLQSKLQVAKEAWENPAMRMYAIDMYDTIDAEWGDDEQNSFWDMVIKSGLVMSRPGAGVSNYIKSTAVLTVLGYSTAWSDSINGKYVPVGINDMALHIPYYPTQSIGLDSETHGYYVELIRDSAIFDSFNQDPQRFFLASPCKTDLTVKMEMRECAKRGVDNADADMATNDQDKQWEYYTTDETNLIEMSKLQATDGTAPTAGSQITEDYTGVKWCDATGLFSWVSPGGVWGQIPAIRIETNMYDVDDNFCYSGSHNLQFAATTIVTLVSVVISIGTSGVGAVLVGPAAVIINDQIDDTKYWPNH